jgi:4-hydroxythreonine-4-phosphate dehydrogenase
MEKIKLGISHGDINGIGYEIIIKTFLDNRILDFCTPIIYGSPKVAAYHRKVLNINNISFNNIASAEKAISNKLNIIDCFGDEIKVELGKSTKEAGQASFVSLEKCVSALKENKIDILITAPINKKNIQSDKFTFQGHTEYLKENFNVDEVLMLLVSGDLRVGVVAGHVPIKDVPSVITKENILKKIDIMNKSLKNDFNIRKPKIAVLGLNPHAGDSGLLGDEENEIIIPAIEEARNKNIMAIGPFAADGFFGSDTYNKFDGIIAMYHDQGLAPFKALAFTSGVNYTAGLPIVRTSPAHGTAYDIAGKNIASHESFREALYMAVEIYKNRKANKDLVDNSLEVNHNTDEERI